MHRVRISNTRNSKLQFRNSDCGYASTGKRATTGDLFEAAPIEIISATFARSDAFGVIQRWPTGRPFSSHFLTLRGRELQNCSYRAAKVQRSVNIRDAP